jgi:hypothetical protein
MARLSLGKGGPVSEAASLTLLKYSGGENTATSIFLLSLGGCHTTALNSGLFSFPLFCNRQQLRGTYLAANRWNSFPAGLQQAVRLETKV